MNMDINSIQKIVNDTIEEDIGSGDITTNYLIDEKEIADGYLLAKEEGVIAGLSLAFSIFRMLDPTFSGIPKFDEGQKVKANTVIGEMRGKLRTLLTGERVALNILQRMSGIATKTAEYVSAIKGTKAQILDTRKTVPGLRKLDKYAVKVGGGTNHRMGLFDMIMIKDNHIKGAKGISRAVEIARLKVKPGIKIEVETTNLDQVKEAVKANADIIMLDNMSVDLMTEAVQIIDGKTKVEASGNITLKNVREVAETGVDYISVGALTHSVKALDISQYIK